MKINMKLTWKGGQSTDAYLNICDQQAKKVQGLFTLECLKTIDPYVPMDTGMLKNSAITASNLDTGELLYNTPYARRQYNRKTTQKDGKRGGQWGDRAKAEKGDYLARYAKGLVKAYIWQS